MMLTCSGGRSSPRLSRSLLPPHSSPVLGLNATPTVFRRPRAKIRPPEPSGLNCETAARREKHTTHTHHTAPNTRDNIDTRARSQSPSSHKLQDDPTARYSLPSGPNRIVRVE